MTSALERLWGPSPPPLGLRLIAAPLWPLSALFRVGVELRTTLYDRRLLRAERIEGLRVVSVGNLTVGGAGKTPATIALAQRAMELGLKVAVLSRGYGRRDDGELGFDHTTRPSVERCGDEPALIAERCPGVRVYVGPDRRRLARRAKSEGAQLALLDDGMQHRRLGRDEEVVVVDGAFGLGNGIVLPRGPLREPRHAFDRATLVWLREPILAPLPTFSAPVVRARYVPEQVLNPDGVSCGVDALRGREVLALCAVARPSGFLRTLEELGAKVVTSRFFRDHHWFTDAELSEAKAQARSLGAELVTTEKDRLRLPATCPAWTVRIRAEIFEGLEHVDAALKGA